jgi:hypothetical protein
MSTTYILSVAAQARDILTSAHAAMLRELCGKLVFISKHNSRSELQITLHEPAPTIFRAGRFSFSAADVLDIRPGANDNWLIVLK